jgi:hypothetical protein
MAIVLLVLAAVAVVIIKIGTQRSSRRSPISKANTTSGDTSYIFADSPDTSNCEHGHINSDCGHFDSSGHSFDGGHAGGFDGGHGGGFDCSGGHH